MLVDQFHADLGSFSVLEPYECQQLLVLTPFDGLDFVDLAFPVVAFGKPGSKLFRLFRRRLLLCAVALLTFICGQILGGNSSPQALF